VTTAIGNDANGSITNLPGGMGVPPMILAYDCEGNLACVSNAVSGAVSLYWYDQHGRRIAKQENGLLTLYIWDGMDIIATANADGTIREYFTRGIGIAGDVGSLVAETRFSGGTATTTYLHSNWRGDVVMATDTSGNVVGEYSYTTFGEQLSATGTYTPRFTFSSKERDASGLVYHGFRYYSPVLCRWISEDPIGEDGGINLYQFCGNNPVNYIDSDGLRAWSESETFDLLMGLRSQAQKGGMKWAWNQYMDSETISGLDFKYLNPNDTFIVEGDCYESDSFGNFVAGWIGQNAGGAIRVLGSLTGGIIFDWGNPSSPNPRWNPDADSRADILSGASYARKINFIKRVNAMYGLP